MVETPKFSFLLVFFFFYYFCNRFNFPSLILRNSGYFFNMYVFLWNFVQEIGARQARIDSFAVAALLIAVLLARSLSNLTHLRMFFV